MKGVCIILSTSELVFSFSPVKGTRILAIPSAVGLTPGTHYPRVGAGGSGGSLCLSRSPERDPQTARFPILPVADATMVTDFSNVYAAYPPRS
jgi:hypothetical protein